MFGIIVLINFTTLGLLPPFANYTLPIIVYLLCTELTASSDVFIYFYFACIVHRVRHYIPKVLFAQQIGYEFVLKLVSSQFMSASTIVVVPCMWIHDLSDRHSSHYHITWQLSHSSVLCILCRTLGWFSCMSAIIAFAPSIQKWLVKVIAWNCWAQNLQTVYMNRPAPYTVDA